jgi:hypothetical protein
MAIESWEIKDGGLRMLTSDESPYLAEAWAKGNAELNQALTDLRRGGEPRPVVLRLEVKEPSVQREIDRIKAGLRRAKEVFDHRPERTNYVTTRAEARAALEPVLGKEARRLFRTAEGSVSYYTVVVMAEGIMMFENRHPKDVPAGPEPAAGAADRMFKVRHRDGNPLNNCRCNLEVVAVSVADRRDAYSDSMHGHIAFNDNGVFVCNLLASEMTGEPLERFLPPFPAANPPELRAEPLRKSKACCSRPGLTDNR